MENTKLDDWRSNITESKETLKLKDGDKVEVTFADEGRINNHVDFGTSIAFSVVVKGETEPRTFYVKSNNYSLLAQIKALGQLVGRNVRISRTGSKRSDTRYKITSLT